MREQNRFILDPELRAKHDELLKQQTAGLMALAAGALLLAAGLAIDQDMQMNFFEYAASGTILAGGVFSVQALVRTHHLEKQQRASH